MSLMLSTIISVMCSIVLIILWCRNPKWRNLHNYLSINQIFFGTLHLCAQTLGPIDIFSELFEHFELLTGCLFFATFSWSLCATLVSYLRLVILVTGKISAEKRKAAAFSYGVLIIIIGVTEGIVPKIFEPHVISKVEMIGSRLISVYIINTINLFLFLSVIKSIIYRKNISTNSKRSIKWIPLIGVAILCDLITTIFLVFLIIEEFTFVQGFDFMHSLFNYRLIPHTFVVIFNKKSKEYWKRRKQLIKLRTFHETI